MNALQTVIAAFISHTSNALAAFGIGRLSATNAARVVLDNPADALAILTAGAELCNRTAAKSAAPKGATKAERDLFKARNAQAADGAAAVASYVKQLNEQFRLNAVAHAKRTVADYLTANADRVPVTHENSISRDEIRTVESDAIRAAMPYRIAKQDGMFVALHVDDMKKSGQSADAAEKALQRARDLLTAEGLETAPAGTATATAEALTEATNTQNDLRAELDKLRAELAAANDTITKLRAQLAESGSDTIPAETRTKSRSKSRKQA